MKPTQEQVIAWAREAGWMNVLWKDQYAEAMECMKKGFALAYEAGRKDENEACAEQVVDCMYVGFMADHKNAAVVNTALQEAINAIRARREQ